jgi:enoyl-CoA hydratase
MIEHLPSQIEPGADDADLVRLEVEGHVAILTLDDPARRNAVSPQLSRCVRRAVLQVRCDPQVRALVLTGAPPVFSAGGDLATLTERTVALAVLYEGFQSLSSLTIPTIAAVNGPAVGAGMNFALACDVIVAARGAVFDLRFLDVGIHPGGGHLWRLQRLVGPQAAAALVIFGERLGAEEAERIGLVWRAVEDADLRGYALKLALRAAGRSAELVRRTKASLAVSTTLTHERLAVDLEETAQEWSMGRPGFAEGVARLRERLSR